MPALFEWHARSRMTGKLCIPKLNDVVLIHEGSSKVVVKRREWKLGLVIGFKEPKRDSHIREIRIKTTSKKLGRPSYLNRSPADLYPLEVEAHQVNDPILESYVTYISDPSEEKPEKVRLPPFWTQPVKLPDTLTYGRKGHKPSKPSKKANHPRQRRAKAPDILQNLNDSGEELGITGLFNTDDGGSVPEPSGDPEWRPGTRHDVKKLVPSTAHTLRPRAPGLGIVIPGKSNV